LKLNKSLQQYPHQSSDFRVLIELVFGLFSYQSKTDWHITKGKEYASVALEKQVLEVAGGIQW